MRAAAALILLLSLVPVRTAESAEPVLSVKGFVISRSEQVLTIHNGGGTRVRVIIGPQTVVRGVRASPTAIGVHDLVRAEGTAAPEAGIFATLIEVVFAGDGLALGGRPNGGGYGSFLLNWIMNGKFTIDLP